MVKKPLVLIAFDGPPLRSGVAGVAKRGLEISVLGCIDINSAQSYFLDAVQTPSGLSKKEDSKYSRTDFYLEQVLDCLKHLPSIVYYVADGFYAKGKIVNGLIAHNKHLITNRIAEAIKNGCKLKILAQSAP